MNTESDTHAELGAPSARGKKLIRNGLLLLVAGSLVYLAAKEIRDRRNAAAGAGGGAVAADTTAATKLIVYYFAEGKDCATCENLAAFTKEAIETGFAKELASGVVVWRTLNVDEKRNEHFVTDYNLYTKSVVLVRVEQGKQVRWKNLESVWDFVYDKPAFVKYIQEQTREYLDAPL